VAEIDGNWEQKSEWRSVMGKSSRWIGWGVGVVLGVGLLGLAANAEPDPAKVREAMKRYEQEAEPPKPLPPKRRPKSRPVPVVAAPAPVERPRPAMMDPAPSPTVDYDHEAWKSAEKCGTAACFRAYLKKYPQGQYAEMAQARLELEAKPESRPAVTTTRPAPAARPNQRFTDNSDGTVTDNQSGLVWLKDANCFGVQDWSAAMASARSLANGACGLRGGSGAGQWRLPSKDEWEALIDKNAGNPALPAGHPFTGVQSLCYWSSTTHAISTGSAWVVCLVVRSVMTGGKAGTHYVWPVRGGR
jgi:hypothetical protein